MKGSKSISFIFILFFLLQFHSLLAQIGFTIKGGPGTNQVQVFFRPDANWNVRFQQIVVVVGYQTSAVAVPPTLPFAWTTNPDLNTIFGAPYTPVLGHSTSLTPAGYTYSFASLQLEPGAHNTTLLAGQEYLIGTFTISGGATTVPIMLMDFDDFGTDGVGNTYVADACCGTYFYVSGGTANFYAGTASLPNTSGSAINSGAGYTFATLNIATTLPLELLSFTANEKNCTAELKWETAEEYNTSHFEIQYSTNGTDFETIGRTEAQGNGPGKVYNYKYAQPNELGYYRLKMVDKDGPFNYSKVVQLRKSCTSVNLAMKVFPNPVRAGQELQLQLIHSCIGDATLTVTSSVGQQILHRAIQLQPGIQQVKVGMPTALGKGMYFITVRNSSGEIIFNTESVTINQ